MGFEEDLQRLFARIIEQNGGNNAKAAESLQINKITFWGWTVGNRKRNETLYKAIDAAGGKLLVPGDALPPYPSGTTSTDTQDSEIVQLREKVASLTRENELLRKLVNLYEGKQERKSIPPPQASTGKASSA